MYAEENTVLKQLERTIKRASMKMRKSDEYPASSITALSKLVKEYRELLTLQQGFEGENEDSGDYYASLETEDGPPMKRRRR